MLKKILINLRWLMIFVSATILFSCNSSIEIAKRHYQSGYFVSIHKKHNDVRQSSFAIIKKEKLQPAVPINFNKDEFEISLNDNPRPINDVKIESNSNSTKRILYNKNDLKYAHNSTPDYSVLPIQQKTLTQSFSNGGGSDVGYYAHRWLIYLGLALVSIFLGYLLGFTTALGFSVLLYIIGGVLLLLAIINFIKWVSFL